MIWKLFRINTQSIVLFYCVMVLVKCFFLNNSLDGRTALQSYSRRQQTESFVMHASNCFWPQVVCQILTLIITVELSRFSQQQQFFVLCVLWNSLKSFQSFYSSINYSLNNFIILIIPQISFFSITSIFLFHSISIIS